MSGILRQRHLCLTEKPMDKKTANATAMAKKVAEEETKFEPKKFSEWKTVKE